MRRVPVTVLKADISGSTPLAERLDPEELRGVLGAYFAALAREIQRHGGTVDKYIGDAVMAVFGLPEPRPDDAARATRAALAMQEAIARENEGLAARYGVRLALRIGVNSGELVVPDDGELSLMGPAVVIAESMEAAAPLNSVLVSESTHLAAARRFRFVPAGKVPIKGSGETVTAYRVDAARTRVAGRWASTPTTGASASLQVAGQKQHVLEEERKVVTVLFADVSVAEGQLGADDVRPVLNAYFGDVAREIQRFGGTIDKYIGDAVMAVFGAPVSHEDDAARAIHAALGIQAAIRKENERLERQHGVRLTVRIGVHTGEVVAGLLPGEVLAYTVTGDAVNTAQRIESVTSANEILVSEDTYALARKTFEFEPVAPLTLKGKARPLPAFRVSRTLEAGAGGGTPLVGRRAELARLESTFALAASGNGQLVHVHGEAGVGKSRVIAELIARLPATTWSASARASSYEMDTPYALVAELVRRAFRVQRSEEETAARPLVEDGLEPLALPFAESAVLLLLEILGYDVRSPLDPEGKRGQLVELLRRFLEHRSATGAFVVVAEDLHWTDEGSAAVLREALADVPRLRCLVLTTARTAETAWDATRIELHALDENVAAELVDLVAGAGLDNQARRTILERTGGNPFFIEEVVRGIGTLRGAAIPATVQELLEARIDALDASPKHVGQRAAVIGRQFWTRVLARVAPDERVPDTLAVLEREAFVAPYETQPEEKYAFRHALVQEVFYQTQLMAQRRLSHASVGAAIESLFAERVDEFVDILAFHFDRSDDNERAVTWLGRAGERAKRLFANAEAIASFTRAAERARRDPALADRLPAVLLGLADVRVLLGELDEALRLYTEVRDGTIDARAWRGIVRVLRDQGRYAEALAAADQAVAALDRTTADLLPLALERAQTLSVSGRFTEALHTARAALGEAGERRDPVVAQLLVRLARSEAMADQAQSALAHGTEAREIVRAHGDVAGELAALRMMGGAFIGLGQLDDAAATYRTALTLAERVGAVAEIAGGLLNLGMVEEQRNNFEDAIAWDRRAATEFDRIRHGSGRAVAYGNLASHLALRGDYEEALERAAQALEVAEAIGHRFTIADVSRTIARVHLGRGEYATAATKAEETASLFSNIGAIAAAKESLQLAADAWSHAGEDERARAAEARARSLVSA